jgi:hypothetical protein
MPLPNGAEWLVGKPIRIRSTGPVRIRTAGGTGYCIAISGRWVPVQGGRQPTHVARPDGIESITRTGGGTPLPCTRPGTRGSRPERGS